MRRSGTVVRGRSTLVSGYVVRACLVGLCGSACGDSVVVAREFSLVSAAVEARDAGSDADEHSDGPHLNFGHGDTGQLGPHAPPPSGAGGSSSKDPHDKSGTGGSGSSGSSSTKSGTPNHS